MMQENRADRLQAILTRREDRGSTSSIGQTTIPSQGWRGMLPVPSDTRLALACVVGWDEKLEVG